MALAKYYEDNCLIADERLCDMEERFVFIEPIVKNNNHKHKVNRRDVFCPKKGVIDLVKRGTFVITMEFQQYLYDEWIVLLRERGWKWNSRKKCWYAAWSLVNYDFAFEFVHGKTDQHEDTDDRETTQKVSYTNRGDIMKVLRTKEANHGKIKKE